MPTNLNATITNNLSSRVQSLSFHDLTTTHGDPAAANPTTIDAQSSSSVIAKAKDPILGPSPSGTFEWNLPSSGGTFVFAYDLHSSPTVFECTQAPDGYSVATTGPDDEGNASAVISAS